MTFSLSDPKIVTLSLATILKRIEPVVAHWNEFWKRDDSSLRALYERTGKSGLWHRKRYRIREQPLSFNSMLSIKTLVEETKPAFLTKMIFQKSFDSKLKPFMEFWNRRKPPWRIIVNHFFNQIFLKRKTAVWNLDGMEPASFWGKIDFFFWAKIKSELRELSRKIVLWVSWFRKKSKNFAIWNFPLEKLSNETLLWEVPPVGTKNMSSKKAKLRKI